MALPSSALIHIDGISSANRWNKVLFRTSPTTNFSLLFKKRGFGFGRVASAAASSANEGVADISLKETPQRVYTWPDNKKPRVCVLGGGFGGLYTALRLESLLWATTRNLRCFLSTSLNVLFSNRCRTSFYLERCMHGKLLPVSLNCLQTLAYSFFKIE